ncbi:MAG: IS66 family transposase [Kouleothrix sp.]|nr:IS66 family transposase [Kouleothrix sp.]
MDDLPQRLGIPDADWARTPTSVQAVVRALVQVVQDQQLQLHAALEQIATLQQRVADLEARLKSHSQNSSKPPSSDPPSAPPRPARVARGRQTGGQKGHPRHERPDPEPDHIDAVRDHFPAQCPQCQTDLADRQHDACAPQVQFVWELPEIRPFITAHTYHTVCCPDCGDLVTAERPPDVPPGAFGARAAAGVALLHGNYHLSHRAVTRLFADFFGFPISLGGVVDLQQVASAALAPVYQAIRAVVVQQDRANLDETGWKEGGRRCWLWTMVTARATAFLIHSSRAGPALRQLIGAEFAGITTSDRHRPYLALDPARHQLCWSHLLRNFQALVDRGGRPAIWGADLLALSALIFALWHRYRDGQIDRATPQQPWRPSKRACRYCCWWLARAVPMRPKGCVPSCSPTKRPSGRSCGRSGSNRPITSPNGRCAARCCGGRAVSARRATPVAALWSASSASARPAVNSNATS